MFRLAYNTNGLAHHRPVEALALLAEIGYRGVAITPDVGPLDPLAPDAKTVRAVFERARELGLELALETGARYLLDPRVKHSPTLLDGDPAARQRRIHMLQACVQLAHDLGAKVVSLWAGASQDGLCADARTPAEKAHQPALEATWQRLVDGLEQVLDRGRELGIQIAFEPEPGMFVERPAGYLELKQRLGARGQELGLSLDIAHLLCTQDLPVERMLRELAPHLVHVSIADIRGGVHEHRMFGEGELDLAGTLNALTHAGFTGLAAVELPRDSHRGPLAAREAWRHLQAALHHKPGR